MDDLPPGGSLTRMQVRLDFLTCRSSAPFLMFVASSNLLGVSLSTSKPSPVIGFRFVFVFGDTTSSSSESCNFLSGIQTGDFERFLKWEPAFSLPVAIGGVRLVCSFKWSLGSDRLRRS